MWISYYICVRIITFIIGWLVFKHSSFYKRDNTTRWWITILCCYVTYTFLIKSCAQHNNILCVKAFIKWLHFIDKVLLDLYLNNLLNLPMNWRCSRWYSLLIWNRWRWLRGPSVSPLTRGPNLHRAYSRFHFIPARSFWKTTPHH